MDLLKSYYSDSEDDFEEKETSSADVKSHREVVGDLDTDSDVKCVSEEKSKAQRKRSWGSDKIVDSFDTETSVRVKKLYPEDNNPDYGKKIDYLHLEDSESDNEVESNDINIAGLTEFAFILSKEVSGPQKPKVTIDFDHENQTCLTKLECVSSEVLTSHFNFGDSSSHSLANARLISESDSQKDLSCKQLEKSVCVETTNQNDINSENDISCIFRDDPRVSDISNRNIKCHLPHQISQRHKAHSTLISSLCWCIPQYSFLYLSAAKDGLLKIWDMYSQKPVQCLETTFALNAAKWSINGRKIFAGGTGKKAFAYDVQTGKIMMEYDIQNIVYSLEVHPFIEEVFLVGTKNEILAFDLRADITLPIRNFSSKCEEVLDIAFLDKDQFVCSTNIVSRDSADRTIMAWEFNTGALLSNQIYLERYTCPSLKVHPTDSCFIAQTNGNYIAAFSSIRPYKRKNKRYMGHKVSGYGIEVDISPDGKYVVSGDVDGCVHFYNYYNTDSILVTPKQNVPINRVKWHPCFSSTLITSTYDGQIHLWK